MGKLVVANAMLKCSKGVAPCPLVVIRPMITACKMPAANIMDYKPMVNIATFGMCNSTSNPAVIALTSAALGVHTPAPCMPNTVAPWSPGAKKVTVEKMAALDDKSKCNCLWGGSIEVTNAGQTIVDVN